MPAARKLKVVVLVVGTFLGVLAVIVYLALNQTLTVQQAGLMSVALLGMYVGFGILIAAHRLISKLD